MRSRTQETARLWVHQLQSTVMSEKNSYKLPVQHVRTDGSFEAWKISLMCCSEDIRT